MIMYQDKIPQNIVEEIKRTNDIKLSSPSIFEQDAFEPLTFKPTENLVDVCFIARDIINRRNSDEIVLISKAINTMSTQGSSLLLSLLQSDEGRESVYSSEGRSLYFLHHFFDLSSLNIKQLVWSEVFAVLTLMQCAQVKLQIEKDYADDKLSKALKQYGESYALQQNAEIADSLARAEVLADIQTTQKTSSRKGGQTKADAYLPLKDAVISLYVAKYTACDNKRAGAIIEAELIEQNNEYLARSNAQDKAVQFATWISHFKNKKLKLPIIL
jgi:hypothetical protein